MNFELHWLSTAVCLMVCGCALVAEANSHCSLEKMKMFAMEACEHLFMQDEPRDKRSLASPNDANLVSKSGYGKFYAPKHYTTIRRGTYPHGGYLKVGFDHFRKLSQAAVFPKYKAKKLNHDKFGEREHERGRERAHGIRLRLRDVDVDGDGDGDGDGDADADAEGREHERFKREHGYAYNNIPYCCFNRCEEEFFC